MLLKDTELYKDVQDLEEVQIGDTVHCRHKKLDITTDARVIKLTYDSIQKKVVDVELGDFKYDYFDDVSSMTNRVESAIRPNGSVVGEQVQGILDGVKTQMQIQSSKAHKTAQKAFLAEDIDPDSETYGAMCWGSMGLMIADSKNPDGSWNWSTFGTGKGFFADYIVAGTMLADRIRGGVLEIGGLDNKSGVFKMLDGQNNTMTLMDNSGILSRGRIKSADGEGRAVTIWQGKIYTENEKGELCGLIEYREDGMYLQSYGGINSAIHLKKDGSMTLAAKEQMHITAKKITTAAGEGKTGTAVFSNGTHLKFDKGILIGGVTKEGAF